MLWMLPAFVSVNPNLISFAMVPFGVAAAWCYSASYFFYGSVCILLRMFLGTLDGLVAETCQKQTSRGEIINRLAPELCDAMLFTAFAWKNLLWGVPALCAAWLTSFSGWIGLAVKKPVQSIGPAGQTDRLAALLLCSFCAAIWNFVDWMNIFLIWCTFGGIATSALRLYRQFK